MDEGCVLMQGIFFSKKIYMTARIVLGLVFISSGTIKLCDLDAFSKVIEAFAILPFEFCYPFAVMISLAEIFFGFGLVVDIKGSLSAIFLMLLVFVAVLGHAVYMGYDIDCGCFGPEDPEARLFVGLKGALARDVCMIVQVLYLYLWRFKNRHFPYSPKIFKQQEVN